jgi:hypothetical protein
MSTRSQIIIKDGEDEQWFYRHSDGYPSGNMPQLYKFMKWLAEGKIRNNVEQSCGWLVLIGAKEYGEYWTTDAKGKTVTKEKPNLYEPMGRDFDGWKCGAYEPCTPVQHGDIEFLYTINLENNTITINDFSKERTFSFTELKKYEDDWDSFENEWAE